ncbi:MAG: protein kinase family protein [Aestuariivirgaceae bacterium]
MARIAFKQLLDNERARLDDDGVLVHEQHRDALSMLLNAAGYCSGKTSPDAAKAVTAYVLHAQLLALRALCKNMRNEQARYEPAIRWCNALPVKTELGDGTPELDGLTYKRPLGAGGYGSIHVYEDADGQEYAVKILSPNDSHIDDDATKKAIAAETMLNFKQECDALVAASNSHSRHVIEGLSALRTDKGKLVMVLEYAPYGSLEKFPDVLLDAERKGLRGEQLYRIKAMLIGDILRGVDAIHRAELIHGDLKPHNIVIGAGGVAKIADFGTAQSGTRFAPSKSPPVDNPRWLGPEVLVAQKSGRELDDIDTRHKEDIEGFFSEQLDLKPKGAATVVRGMTSNRVYQEKAKVTVGAASDLWALGAIAFFLAYDGRDLVDESVSGPQTTAIEEKLLAFRPKQLAVGHTDDDGSVQKGFFMGDDGGDFGGTVNMLIRANPKRRISLDALLAEWPSEEELGGQATRDLIVALASGRWKPAP